MKALQVLQLLLAAGSLCFSSASFAQQAAQADVRLNSEMGVLLMVLALILAFTVVARRAPHDSEPVSASGRAANVRTEANKPAGAAVLHLPERSAATAADSDTEGDTAGVPPSRIAS